MTATQIATRKNLYRRIRNLSESDARLVNEYIDDLEGHEPNEETIAAIREVEEGRNLSRTYSDVHEMMKDLLCDCDA